MELNEKLEKELTTEQKVKFQKDNGKFKLLNNIVLLPIATSLIGVYLESIVIVSISIILIIIFLILKICSFSKRNAVYEDVIIPSILSEKFDNIHFVKENSSVSDEFKNSKLINEYDKVKVKKLYVIDKEKYNVYLSKIIVEKLNIEENDGVVDKDLEEKFNGIFAYVKLPTDYAIDFKCISKNDLNSDNEKVKIAYSEFDNCYDVYSSAPVETRNILSAGVMARIIEFNARINNIINFSVYNNMLYVSINYKQFLEFKGEGRKYVNEVEAIKNLDTLEILDVFIRYFVNIYEKEKDY